MKILQRQPVYAPIAVKPADVVFHIDKAFAISSEKFAFLAFFALFLRLVASSAGQNLRHVLRVPRADRAIDKDSDLERIADAKLVAHPALW